MAIIFQTKEQRKQEQAFKCKKILIQMVEYLQTKQYRSGMKMITTKHILDAKYSAGVESVSKHLLEVIEVLCITEKLDFQSTLSSYKQQEVLGKASEELVKEIIG